MSKFDDALFNLLMKKENWHEPIFAKEKILPGVYYGLVRKGIAIKDSQYLLPRFKLSLTDYQLKAYRVLLGNICDWVSPKEFGLPKQSFDALVRRGMALKSFRDIGTVYTWKSIRSES